MAPFAPLFAQSTSPNELSTEFVEFFEGGWTGEGEFSSGKKIKAELTFEKTLDGNWLRYEHKDLPPNNFQSSSMWGVDKQGQFQAYSFDNDKGHRSFASNGWINNKLILTNTSRSKEGMVYFEHFIFEKIDETSFKMTYEISGDGINWRMVDYLIFRKNI